jgi:hypothetical protein
VIEGLCLLGEAIGYASDPEYPFTGSGGAVDVAWLRDGDDREPLFVFEVETTASSSAANNPLKVFAQPTTELTDRLLRFGEHYRQIARPFDWTFSRADLERVLAKITEREPRLALAA